MAFIVSEHDYTGIQLWHQQQLQLEVLGPRSGEYVAGYVVGVMTLLWDRAGANPNYQLRVEPGLQFDLRHPDQFVQQLGGTLILEEIDPQEIITNSVIVGPRSYGWWILATYGSEVQTKNGSGDRVGNGSGDRVGNGSEVLARGSSGGRVGNGSKVAGSSEVRYNLYRFQTREFMHGFMEAFVPFGADFRSYIAGTPFRYDFNANQISPIPIEGYDIKPFNPEPRIPDLIVPYETMSYEEGVPHGVDFD